MVLSGCKELVLHDTKNTTIYDLNGQFFLGEKDLGYNRAERSLIKLQELNYYVKVSLSTEDIFRKNLGENDLEKMGFKRYDVIILTECDNNTIIVFDNFCRKNNIYLIICDVYGCFGRIINDFGSDFEVIDKDGESIKECYIKNIELSKENKNEIIISTNKGEKHGFEDGDLIEFFDFNEKELKNLNMQKFNIKVISPEEFNIEEKKLGEIFSNINLNISKNSDINLGKCRQVKQKINMNFKEIEKLLGNKNI